MNSVGCILTPALYVCMYVPVIKEVEVMNLRSGRVGGHLRTWKCYKYSTHVWNFHFFKFKNKTILFQKEYLHWALCIFTPSQLKYWKTLKSPAAFLENGGWKEGDNQPLLTLIVSILISFPMRKKSILVCDWILKYPFEVHYECLLYAKYYSIHRIYLV